MRATILLLLLFPLLARAQSPSTSPSPSPTPFPSQDEPPAATPTPTPRPYVPGYDDAIHVPGEPNPTPTPDPFFFRRPSDEEPEADWVREARDDKWDPSKVFPGNYRTLPLTVDLGWRPCLDCGKIPDGNLYRLPGDISLWAGYAFQPYMRSTSPFMAGGVEWVFGRSDKDGHLYSQSQVRPTWRFGWNFTAAAVYGSAGLILPDAERKSAGYHLGIGVSSIAMLAVAVCSAEAIPSVIEAGYDVQEDVQTRKMSGEFVLKLGWGF